MASNWGSIVMCPYYLSEGRKSIRCEGIITEATQLWWKDALEKIEFKERYCETMNYKCCPIAALLEDKYKKE